MNWNHLATWLATMENLNAFDGPFPSSFSLISFCVWSNRSPFSDTTQPPLPSELPVDCISDNLLYPCLYYAILDSYVQSPLI